MLVLVTGFLLWVLCSLYCLDSADDFGFRVCNYLFGVCGLVLTCYYFAFNFVGLLFGCVPDLTCGCV